MEKPKLILVGGFLGAGKTTLLSMAAQYLKNNHTKVGLITNDQAAGLVDTHILEYRGFEVQEISGSCFCCNFNGFYEAIDNLVRSYECDVILAEPVGSCTDLYATLIRPLKTYFGDLVELAPLSVLVDPLRLQHTVGETGLTTEGPGYIYLKQLEEADCIVINKLDNLIGTQKENLEQLLTTKFPDKPLCWISAKNGQGVSQWAQNVLTGAYPIRNRHIEVDYEIYAEGEAQMGWYNGTFVVGNTENRDTDWKAFNRTLLTIFTQLFGFENTAVAHLKTFIKQGASHVGGNMVEHNEISTWGEEFYAPTARLVLNIRAEAPHLLIHEMVEDVLEHFKEQGFLFEAVDIEHFAPGYPRPTYRLSEV